MIRPRRYQVHHYLMMLLAWPIVAVAAALLYLRWQEVDKVLLIAIVALTPFLAVPLIPAALSAWFSRSNVLRATAAVVIAAYLYTVAPFDAVVGCGPEQSERAITIMTTNVQFHNGNPEAIADQVRAVNPDVLFMQESNLEFLQIFDEQPELEPWGHRSHQVPDAVRGAVVWSKWPLSNIEFDRLSVYQSVVGNIATPYGDVTFAGVHTTSPTDSSSITRWTQQLNALSQETFSGPTILAGDFNATEDHAPFRHLLGQGWTDVHDNKGCGLDQTWPTNTLPFPVMRLDHVLVTDDFSVLSTGIVEVSGSDHLAVVTQVELGG